MTASRLAIIKRIILLFTALLLLLFSDSSYAGGITQRQLLQRLDMHEAPLIVDVRRPDEFATGHVPSAINIPHTELDKRLDELNGNINQEVVLYCESGRRAAIAQDILERAGFTKVMHLEGDMKSWRERRLPTEGDVSR